MSGLNRVTLIGNLGRDPEVKHLENNRMKASFTLATNEVYKNKDGQKMTHTDWHNIVLWSPLAEIAQKYLTKGRQIYVEGKLVSRSYSDREGQVKYITEVVGRNFILLGSSKENNAELNPKEEIPVSELPSDDLFFD